jgi:hypothetical protein
MAARQRPAVASPRQSTAAPPLEVLGRDEPSWLWDSLRYQFWRPSDFAYGFRHVDRLRPEQREGVASWWSLVAAAEELGPRMYAAAFVRATEQCDSDELRWSLLAMLRDELQHEQLFRLAIQQLEADGPQEPQTATGRQAGGRLDRVTQEAERCWHEYRGALDRHGIDAVSGALLLRALVIGKVYEHWACGCAVPAFATAFRHAAHDAERHQAALRALAVRDWPKLSTPQRAAAVEQVQATAKLLCAVMLDPVDAQQDAPVGQGAGQTAVGVATAQQRQEMLRTSLLEIKNLQARYHIPFPAMPELAILGNREDADGVRKAGGAHGPPAGRRSSLHSPSTATAR